MSGLPENTTSFEELMEDIQQDMIMKYGGVMKRWVEMIDTKFKEIGSGLGMRERKLIDREAKYEEDMDNMVEREKRFENYERDTEDRLFTLRKDLEAKEKSLITKRDALSQKDAKLKALEEELSEKEKKLAQEKADFDRKREEWEASNKKKLEQFDDAVKRLKKDNENSCKEFVEKHAKFESAKKLWLAEKEKEQRELDDRRKELKDLVADLDDREGMINLQEVEIRQTLEELEIRSKELEKKSQIIDAITKMSVTTPLGKWNPLAEYIELQVHDGAAKTDADRQMFDKLLRVTKSLHQGGFVLYIRSCAQGGPEGETISVAIALKKKNGEFVLVAKGDGEIPMVALKGATTKLLEVFQSGRIESPASQSQPA